MLVLSGPPGWCLRPGTGDTWGGHEAHAFAAQQRWGSIGGLDAVGPCPRAQAHRSHARARAGSPRGAGGQAGRRRASKPRDPCLGAGPRCATRPFALPCSHGAAAAAPVRVRRVQRGRPVRGWRRRGVRRGRWAARRRARCSAHRGGRRAAERAGRRARGARAGVGCGAACPPARRQPAWRACRRCLRRPGTRTDLKACKCCAPLTIRSCCAGRARPCSSSAQSGGHGKVLLAGGAESAPCASSRHAVGASTCERATGPRHGCYLMLISVWSDAGLPAEHGPLPPYAGPSARGCAAAASPGHARRPPAADGRPAGRGSTAGAPPAGRLKAAWGASGGACAVRVAADGGAARRVPLASRGASARARDPPAQEPADAQQRHTRCARAASGEHQVCLDGLGRRDVVG